jgi:alpha-galactosidase
MVNTWEAVYFDHDWDRLASLADAAAEVGAERLVLDDGWFRGRRNDHAGLGDWTVDTDVWPKGLHPLIERLKGQGLEFGLWVEPEMVNLDSDLVRAHPDWVLRGRNDLPVEWRKQHVLDLQEPGAYAHVRDALVALLEEYDVAFLKWDHNRDLVDVARDGVPAVHGQTLALYRLLGELRDAFPTVEIETCASGGGRIDLEVLRYADRVWASDTIDSLERQTIQRWTSLLVPPERLGAHIGSPVAHTTGRAHRLGFRAATAVLFSLGIEWDISSIDEADLADVARWVALHQRIRPLIGTGRLVHPDHPDPALMVTGIVGADRAEAWYVVAATASTQTQFPTPLQLTGLDPRCRYRVTRETATLDQHGMDLGETWTVGDGVVVPGSVLVGSGLRLPLVAPDTAHVFRVVAETTANGPTIDSEEGHR